MNQKHPTPKKVSKSGLNKSLWIVIIAAVLLELISVVQYYSTRQILSDELERKEEMGLRMKAIVIKSMLNSAKSTVHDHLWDVMRNLSEPDSMYAAVEWLVKMNPIITGGGITFVPNYYPEKGRLFEPYARRCDSTIVVSQIASEQHDYTKREFYNRAISSDRGIWTSPYHDEEGARAMVTTYAVPIHDSEKKNVGVLSVDIALDWLGDTLNYNHFYPSSFNLLLTEEGKIISKPNENHINIADVPQVVESINDSTIERHTSKSSHIKVIRFKSQADDADGSIFYADMKGKPKWKIVAVSYDEDVYAPVNTMWLRVLLLTLAAFCILGYIIRRFAQNQQKLGLANLKQEKINNELRIASAIQQTMLPNANDEIANRSDIQLSGLLNPAKGVGGDLYCYFIRDEKLFFCIGDVSGKGVPSALVMSVIQALFRNTTIHTSNPARIMQNLNESLCRNNASNMFVTMFIGVLDLPSGRLRYCNAGHDIPILVEQDSQLDVEPNLPIGVFNDFHYQHQEILFDEATTLFLYTDGLTEAMNQQHELFGLERVKQALEKCQGMTPSEIQEKIAESVRLFVGETEQSDDLTMMTIHFIPQHTTVILDEEVRLTNNIHQVKELNQFVKSVAERLEMDKATEKNIMLAVEEAVVNVMGYAYPIETTGEVKVRSTSDGHTVKFVISDQGKYFDPTEIEKPDITLGADDRPIGGLGILLVRELMDSVNYERVNNYNILTLSKKYK